ncbi:hypothetical protein NQ315_007519 [Exocentrus adspersus]|uniref:Cathepsin O n=1 Tax=Exocentrus adspersus TaxID=1586481 RepID=A0AAV8W8J1_9CUCU|nr:hypothetical protein NQ315_007519 [Exocentrus adspersus]
MPNTVGLSRRKRWVEYLCYFLLLLFFVPIKIRSSNEDEQFRKYMADFNKSYSTTEYYQRLEAFKHSLKTIELLNANQTNNTAQYGYTKFSDMLPEEFVKANLLPIQLKRILLPQEFTTVGSDSQDVVNRIRQAVMKTIPQKIDWREKNSVSKVQSQQSCSACWAFAGVGMIESVNAIKTGRLEPLSVQNVIDCSPFDGCEGGNVCGLLSWMKTYRIKIDTESNYPLTLTNEECRNVSDNGVYVKDYSCHDFVGSEEGILRLLALNGPVAVAINALSWQNYVGGVIQFHCDGNPSKLNHAVEIVGYDLSKEVPYYIVKNSWGEDFGDNGYLYVAIGKNMCGLAYEVAAVKM